MQGVLDSLPVEE
jgi:hypothetical protein